MKTKPVVQLNHSSHIFIYLNNRWESIQVPNLPTGPFYGKRLYTEFFHLRDKVIFYCCKKGCYTVRCGNNLLIFMFQSLILLKARFSLCFQKFIDYKFCLFQKMSTQIVWIHFLDNNNFKLTSACCYIQI